MTTRRDFLRQGSLWVAGVAALPIVEPYVKRLWAFPTNPAARQVMLWTTGPEIYGGMSWDLRAYRKYVSIDRRTGAITFQAEFL